MGDWSFLTNHAQVLVCIAHDPGVRLRDIASKLGITERTAYAVVDDLAKAGYVVKDKAGRGRRYVIRTHLPLRAAVTGERTIGEILDLLSETDARRQAGEDPQPAPGQPGNAAQPPAPPAQGGSEAPGSAAG